MNILEYLSRLFKSVENPAREFNGKRVMLTKEPTKKGFAFAPRIEMVKVFWDDGSKSAEFIKDLTIIAKTDSDPFF